MLARTKARKSNAQLQDPRLIKDAAYLDGRWRAADDGKTVPVTNPASGAEIGVVPRLGVTETNQAIAAASDAFASWRALLAQERARLLRRWFEAINANAEDLARLMTLEQGKPLPEARGEIAYAASFVEWYAEEAKRVNVESVTSHLAGAEMSVMRQPVGVVALITPWNFPSAMITRKAAAALAAGCTVVVNPSGLTPLSALALAELAERAGLPAGVFNVVTGPGSVIGPALCASRHVRAVSFTGSTEIGRQIAAQCAPTIKTLVMELGGHAPFIVFDDADFERAVDGAVAAKFATSGQDCLAANRIFVQRAIYDRFVAAFVARVGALKVAEGFAEGAEIGPLMHDRAIAKCEEHVRDARDLGARVAVGGARHEAGPLFFQPTVLADVPSEAAIMREETFGPVAAIAAFDHEDEVITRANDTEYGLIAYAYTTNGGRQRRLANALDYGMVALNRAKVTGAPIPFGGVKQSGLGREGSRAGLEAFTEIKYVCAEVA